MAKTPMQPKVKAGGFPRGSAIAQRAGAKGGAVKPMPKPTPMPKPSGGK